MPGWTRWAAFERRPATAWSEWEVCLRKWLLFGRMQQEAPERPLLPPCSTCSSLGVFQVQISLWMLQQDASAGRRWTNAGCCSEGAGVSQHLCSPLSPPPSLPPSLPPTTLAVGCYRRGIFTCPSLPSHNSGPLKAHIIDQCRFRPLWLMWEILYFCINVYWL